MTRRFSSPSHPSQHCAVEFQALPWRIGQVRRIISAQLRYWHLDPLIDRTALAVTELLANVHEHAGPDKRCSVELMYVQDRLTVSVRDHGPDMPRLRSSGALATDGRGMALVAALSKDWGMQPRGDAPGKVVWFTVPVRTPAPCAVPPAAAEADLGDRWRMDVAAAGTLERQPSAAPA
ncbi:ATP-binding protein [Streptomyces oceani]|uniref:ATP-binding protein n=1 Tax=Streptomyces oceani TaxID=1075402 RepID=UPI000B142E4D|nr:ATP-binding protein [Streptomyces oceani]